MSMREYRKSCAVFGIGEKMKVEGLQVVPNQESVSEVEGYLEDLMSEADVPMKTIFKVNVAIDEIYSNIVNYSGAECAIASCIVEGGEIVLTFADNGMQYDPTKEADPDLTASADEREIGGLGIFMTKELMDEVIYEYDDGWNVLTMKKSFDK